MIFQRIFSLRLLLVASCLTAVCNGLTPAQEDDVDRVVNDVFIEENGITGMSLTIVEQSGDVYAKGYGHADIAQNILANQDTKFCIASITKTFTATLVMKVLSEKFPELGASVLETPLKTLYPSGNFTFSDRFRSQSMSFRDLLSHRHGLQTESLGSSAGAFKDIEEYTYRSRYAPQVAPFRAGGYYSNTLYALAGKLIAEIAEQPYDQLLQSLFDELGMTNSALIAVDLDLENMENMSKGYFLKDGVVTKFNTSLLNRVFVGAPAGGIITTAADMSKYISFHLNLGKVGDKQVISEEAMLWLREPAAPLDMMTFNTPESSLISGSYAMGTGFQLAVYDGQSYISHNGQWSTFMSELRIYPELSFGTFSVNNGPIEVGSVPHGHGYLHNEIFAIIHGLSGKNVLENQNQNQKIPRGKINFHAQPSFVQTQNSSINQESVVGNYGHPVEGELAISYPNETLYIQFGKWATGYLFLYPELPNTFTISWDSDFVQDIYFGAGSLVDIYVQFLDIDTLNIVFGDARYEFKRGVNLDTLPLIPWDPTSCAPALQGK